MGNFVSKINYLDFPPKIANFLFQLDNLTGSSNTWTYDDLALSFGQTNYCNKANIDTMVLRKAIIAFYPKFKLIKSVLGSQPFLLLDGWRSKSKQDSLSSAVTKVKYPNSRHNWGLAVDIGFTGIRWSRNDLFYKLFATVSMGKEVSNDFVRNLKDVSQKLSDFEIFKQLYEKSGLVSFANSLGMNWGGLWTGFGANKNEGDALHFESKETFFPVGFSVPVAQWWKYDQSENVVGKKENWFIKIINNIKLPLFVIGLYFAYSIQRNYQNRKNQKGRQ